MYKAESKGRKINNGNVEQECPKLFQTLMLKTFRIHVGPTRFRLSFSSRRAASRGACVNASVKTNGGKCCCGRKGCKRRK